MMLAYHVTVGVYNLCTICCKQVPQITVTVNM